MSSTYVYLVGTKDRDLYKIGVSAHPRKRLYSLQNGCPARLAIVHTVLVHTRSMALEIEDQLHKLFASNWQTGEWFQITEEEACAAMNEAAARAIDRYVADGGRRKVPTPQHIMKAEAEAIRKQGSSFVQALRELRRTMKIGDPPLDVVTKRASIINERARAARRNLRERRSS